MYVSECRFSICGNDATKQIPCGPWVCDGCFEWIMGRITCPFHGDDNC